MHEELDYCNESDNVRMFRAFHARQHPFVVVPEVIGHRSAKRVLTLAYEPGDHIRDFDQLGYTTEERDRCGRHLWLAMESQIFEHGVIHADPNPGELRLPQGRQRDHVRLRLREALGRRRGHRAISN